MRVLAISDLHVDYEENARWLSNLSRQDYRDDVLILAGDVSDSVAAMEWSFAALALRFAKVVFVPGNHDLWLSRHPEHATSFDKLERIRVLARQYDVAMEPYHAGAVSVVPLFGWYDYSFGVPTPELREAWADYRACRWPAGLDEPGVTAHFTYLNEPVLGTRNETIISFSHFLPRIDVMPDTVPIDKRMIYPVLGTSRLERQIRQLRSSVHVYGHSHVNQQVTIDGVWYVNSAFGYPSERRITQKRLTCVHEGPSPD